MLFTSACCAGFLCPFRRAPWSPPRRSAAAGRPPPQERASCQHRPGRRGGGERAARRRAGAGAVRGAHRQQAGSDSEDGPEGQHPARRLHGAVRPLACIEKVLRRWSVAASLASPGPNAWRATRSQRSARGSGQGDPRNQPDRAALVNQTVCRRCLGSLRASG